jgi:hypothetical protein
MLTVEVLLLQVLDASENISAKLVLLGTLHAT